MKLGTILNHKKVAIYKKLEFIIYNQPFAGGEIGELGT